MTSLLVPALVTGFGFAVLGVQYAVWCAVRNRLQIIHDSAFHIDRMTVEAKLRFNHIDAALDEHATGSEQRHATTAKIVNTAMVTFENHAETFSANAEKLKVHAQELLDRSETHAITPRQAVSR